MSWLSSAWDRNRDFLGNAVKNVSPALAFVPGLGIPAAFAAGAAGRAMQHGTNIGDILKSGASNAAIGGGARSLVGAAKSAFVPSSEAGGFASQAGGGWAPTGPTAASEEAPSLSARFASLGGGVKDFAKENAGTLGQAGSGILNARESGQANDLRQRQLDFQQQQYTDEQEQKKRMAALLAPLYAQLQQQQHIVAPNPYGAR